MTIPRFDSDQILRGVFAKIENSNHPSAGAILVGMAAEAVPIAVYFHLSEFVSVIDKLLDEAKSLLPLNASASFVWSMLAFELLVKEGLCRPALTSRLEGDLETSTEIYRSLIERNGGKGASAFLKTLLGIDVDNLKSTSDEPIWPLLVDSNTGLISTRNKVIHRGDVASSDEAETAWRIVQEFARIVFLRLEEMVQQDLKDFEVYEV